MCCRSESSGPAIAPVITTVNRTGQPATRLIKRLAPALFLLLILVKDARPQNPIVTENSLPGNPKSEWDISGAGDMSIQGFATDMSVNKGSTVRFKINVEGSTTYSIRIYRLGYYQGNGARRVDQLGPFNGIRQQSPVSQSATGLVDCGNWTESASWNVPATAVSGVYIAKLIRTDNGGSSHIVFVVRDDQRNAGLLFKTSDATWQAYNVYGGNSLYTGSTSYPSGHAVKVSYNRPFITRDGAGGGGIMEDWLFNAEYPMIRWLERNGYDMVYTTDVDMERDQRPITPARYKALLSVGHDEYWSLAERTRVENARDAGVHLAFFSGNEVYWKTRWENSIDGSGTPHRTLVCYKEGTAGENVCGDKCDPLTNTWTGLWRSGCQYSADGCKPENALTGQISWVESTGSIRVTDAFKDLPIWRNTSIASLGPGQSVTFPNGTLGYEWDAIESDYAASYPAGRQALSRTTLDGRVHELSLYQHPGGALVFGAGTIQWSWGLDNVHDRGNAAPSRDMQQATVNLFSDMGVQPGSLQADLVPGIPAGDTLPPTTQITFPANLTQLASGKTYTITGTATDSGGGTVALVEVSTDNGTTWQQAQGTGSWFYSWTPADTGYVTIRARATDNSGNRQLTATIPSVTVRIGQPVYSIWPPDAAPVRIADPDMVPIEVGVKFRPKVNGFITGIRFYKGPTNTGTHIGTLWTATGTNLGRATFSGETSGGWQEVLLPNPVPVTAGTIYVASYHTNVGQYSSDEEYFTGSGVSTPYLEALGNGVSGDNGLYTYSATPTFPTQGYRSTNFWVDVIFTLNNVADTTPPAISSTSPAPGSAGVSPVSAVTVRFSEPVDAATVTGSVFQLRDSLNVQIAATVTYDPATWTASLKPAAPLSGESRYTAVISGGSILDLSGNALAAGYTWDFRTSKEVFSIWPPSARPLRDTDPDEQPVEVGVKFRPLADGFITGIRFYKSSGNTGTHVGSLWTRAGLRLAQATFVNESSNGWQEVLFDEPVQVTTGTVYVASYHTNTGRYASDLNYFTTSVGTPYLEALRDGADGVNGVYRYTADPAFPSEGYLASNFWVDVVFVTSIGPDTTPPHVLATSPLNGDAGVSPAAAISATFNEPLDTNTVSGTTFRLRDSGGNTLNATVSYQESTRTAILTPEEPLAYNSSYTAVIKGQPGGDGIRDRAANALDADYTWSFSTGGPPPVPPAEGPGGPILVISTASNPFSRYPVEILRAEGLNAFTAMDISQVSAPVLNSYDVVILGEVPLTAAQVTMFTNWTISGGTFIAFRPDSKLAPLMGLTRISGSLANRYLKVNAGPGPGSGIVSETIQFHGSADLYTLNGASALATLYSAANTPTANPAVTTNSVGTAGGRAVAFTYDLARSIVYTRQGNPAWAGQERDGQSGPVRSDDLFFGDAFFDPQPDWIDLDKVSIPQADEQQRLLANIMITSNLHRKPLPRFWYLPKGLKAAVVMTGDDHATGGTATRFDQYRNLSPSNTAEAVANWSAIRGTSYIYPGTPITNQQVIQLQQDGFEIALHLNTGCSAYTAASLTENWTTQGGSLRNQLPGVNPLATGRTHCMPWSDWATQAKVQAALGVRIDVNYYYWPGSWVQNRPGMFTGSGMPMRFADLDGTLIDCYQVPTQITDESDISSYTSFMNSLLDKARGPEGYFGVFCANMHTDNGTSEGSDEIINSAMARQIPVVSAKQMLDWLDGRNNSSFGSLDWLGNRLHFSVSAAAGSRNMKGMLPDSAATGKLAGLTLNGSPVSFTIEKIKGISYAFFDAVPGNFEATYGTAACLVTHPADTTVTSFTQARFTAGSTDDGATYQWQVSTDNGTTYADVRDDTSYAGSQDRTLTINGVTRALDNYRYRCIIGGACPVTTGAATLSVGKAAQTITWSDPAPITYGTVLDARQLNATVSGAPGGTVTGSLTYTPAAGTRIGAGTHTLTVTAAATDDYLEAVGSVNLTVGKAEQTITWADPDPIRYGTILDSVQLNASISGVPGGTAPGALRYTPAAGSMPRAGFHTLTVTAEATENYLEAAASVNLTVDKAAQTITWANPASIPYGTALDAQQLNASVSGIPGGTAPGALTYAPAAGIRPGAGSYTLTVTAGATDDYLEATGSVSLTVDKAVQTLEWADPDAIMYGTILGSAQLNASVSGVPGGTAPGALTYTPAAGTRPGAGIQTLTVTAAATDNYLEASRSAKLTVQKRPVSAAVAVADKVYDGSVGAQISSRSLTGILPDDQVSLAGGTAAFSDRHAGTMKEVTISGLTLAGPSAANYTLTTDTVSATASIAPLAVQGTFTVADKAYSGTTSAVILSRAIDGALPADSVSLWGGTAEFNDASVGNSKTVTATGIRLGGSYPGNYRLEPAILTSQANITPRSVTGSIKVTNKIYDGNTDAVVSSASLSGLLAGDAGKVELTGGTARFTGSTVGSKRVLASGFTLSGPAAGNYSLLTPSFSATASITKRPVTVTARAGQSKVAGAPDPVFQYDITSGTLVAGDQFSGRLARTSGEATGIYPILKGSLALDANYELTFQSSGFLITDPVATTTSPDNGVKSAQLEVTPRVHLTGYPNPFAGQAIAEFMVPRDESFVTLAMYDLRGQKVSDLYAGTARANQLYRLTIRGSGVPPGAYFLRLTLRNRVENFKIIMLE